jgi:hypothetical protein
VGRATARLSAGASVVHIARGSGRAHDTTRLPATAVSSAPTPSVPWVSTSISRVASRTVRRRAVSVVGAARGGRAGAITGTMGTDSEVGLPARGRGMQRLRRRVQLALDRKQIAALSEYAIIRVQHAKIHTQVVRQG